MKLTENQLRRIIRDVIEEAAEPEYGTHNVTDTFYQGNEYHGSKPSNEIDEDIEMFANRIEKLYKDHGFDVSVSFKRNTEERAPHGDVDTAFDSTQPISKRKGLARDTNNIIVACKFYHLSLDKLENFIKVTQFASKMSGKFKQTARFSYNVSPFIDLSENCITLTFPITKYNFGNEGTTKARQRTIGKRETGGTMRNLPTIKPHWTY
jgi:hypothetical protein